MTRNGDSAVGQGGFTIEPRDAEVDHVRGSPARRLIVEYGDYERPYSRKAHRTIERVERRLGDRVRFALRHFPLTQIHSQAASASAAAEAAALQGRCWEMHELLFHNESALEPDDLGRYAAELGLDLARFAEDQIGDRVRERIARDVRTAVESSEIRGTPTLSVDGEAHRGAYDAASLLDALAK